jgi:hypothetical protein
VPILRLPAFGGASDVPATRIRAKDGLPFQDASLIVVFTSFLRRFYSCFISVTLLLLGYPTPRFSEQIKTCLLAVSLFSGASDVQATGI